MLKMEFKTKEEAALYTKELELYVKGLEGLIVEMREALNWSYGLVEPSPGETDFDREVKAILEKTENFKMEGEI